MYRRTVVTEDALAGREQKEQNKMQLAAEDPHDMICDNSLELMYKLQTTVGMISDSTEDGNLQVNKFLEKVLHLLSMNRSHLVHETQKSSSSLQLVRTSNRLFWELGSTLGSALVLVI
jgi:hypothetical protein